LRLYVVDASVAARFLLVEEFSDKAEWLLQKFHDGAIELKAPMLVRYEVGNTLWKAVKQGLVDVHEASQKFSQFIKLKVDCIELNEQECLSVLTWAARNDASYYDSVYVKACEMTGATLLTADDALHEKASKEVPVLHLRDLEKD
jgi:predicted nucleic acid-binding protein